MSDHDPDFPDVDPITGDEAETEEEDDEDDEPAQQGPRKVYG